MCRGKIIKRSCPTEMIIYVPVDVNIQKALVVIRNPHNHPVHPKTKPTAADKQKFVKAVEAVGITGLTVQKLLNGTLPTCLWASILNSSWLSQHRLRHSFIMENHFQKVVPHT